MDPLELDTVKEWREWLSENHVSSNEVWLVLRKGRSKVGSLTMKEAVGEAICFGWIDSRTKRMDDHRYLLRLTPRKKRSNWSTRNLIWARELIDQGRMTDAGLSLLPPDFRNIPERTRKALDDRPVPELEAALGNDADLSARYAMFANGQRKEFDRWILAAKRPETRRMRVDRTVELIRMGRSLTKDIMDG